MFRIWIQLLIIFSLVSFARAESPKTLWVLQEPDEIAAYELPSFAAQRTMKVPRRLLEHPEYLRINSRGQMLFHPIHGEEWAAGEMATAGHLVWFWDGQKAREWKLLWIQKSGTSRGQATLTETKAQSFLSADGESLFWFENQFDKVIDESGAERSVHTGFRVWRTDLAGNNPADIVQSSIPGRCECGTGFCSETCPEFSFWAPGDVISDFFLVTRFTPGQIGSTYYETYLYQLSGREWLMKKLARVAENPLDASEAGELLITAVPDGGCCGGQNDSDDQTLVLRRGTVSVIYDEFKRFGNRDYDVSFYTAEARIAPGKGRLAYTLASTATPGNEIRLSLDGKGNPEELSRIRKALTDLPAVEVLKLGPQPQLEKTIPHAALVGWLNEAEILIARDGKLTVFNVGNGAQRPTAIRVRGAADAFLR